MKKSKECKDTNFYNIIRPIISSLFKIFYKPRIINSHYIQKKGKIILAGNHTNNLDCLLVMSSTKRQIHFLAKKELLKGAKKIIFNNLGIIPVDRNIKDKTVIPKAKEYLKKNLVIGIFPEGTTEKEVKKLLPFKTGAVRLSHETDTSIIPFKIEGTYKLFSKNLKIIFSKPIKATENIEDSNKKLYKIIEDIKDVD